MRFDDDEPWDLPIAGFEVVSLTDGAYPGDIVALGRDGARATIGIVDFEFHHPDGSIDLVDTEQPTAEILAVLRGDTICLARVTKTSELRIEFASGHVITSFAAEDYENWEIFAPGKYDGIAVIALPGGGEPAIWDGETPPLRLKMLDSKRVDVTEGSEPAP